MQNPVYFIILFAFCERKQHSAALGHKDVLQFSQFACNPFVGLMLMQLHNEADDMWAPIRAGHTA